MEGSTPDWADTEDYATLEEVFAARTFGQPLPEVAAAAVPVTAAAVAPPTGLTRNRTIASFAAVGRRPLRRCRRRDHGHAVRRGRPAR